MRITKLATMASIFVISMLTLVFRVHIEITKIQAGDFKFVMFM